MLTLPERVERYNDTWGAKYPDSRLRMGSGRIYGLWFLGNNYQNKTRYYGAYPPGYLPRVTALFPDCTSVLHLFSGSLPKSKKYTRFDLRVKAEVKGDAHKLGSYFLPEFDIIFADPPYNREAARVYGTSVPNRARVMQECYKVLQPGGFVVWLDTVWPMARKDQLKMVGCISIVRSQNHIFRNVIISQAQ